MLTGSNASTDGTGLIVTLDGSPDLTNVATDGSHVIYLADATAGARNFSKITNKDPVAFTVTVANAFGASQSGKSWAIGGKRAGIGTTASRKLGNQTGGGDALPGWKLYYVDGSTDSISSQWTMNRSGNTTDGHIVIGTKPGFTTRAKITQTANARVIHISNSSLIETRDLELECSNATKTNAYGVGAEFGGAGSNRCINLKSNGTNKLRTLANPGSGSWIEGCEAVDCTNEGIIGSSRGVIVACVARGCTVGIQTGAATANAMGPRVENCIAYGNTSHGIELVSGSGQQAWAIKNNTSHGNGGAGIKIGVLAVPLAQGALLNNNVTGNTGWGVDLDGATLIAASIAQIRNNNFGTGLLANGSGTISTTGAGEDNQTYDPGYANAAAGDFTQSSGVTQGLGFPDFNIGNAP